MAARTLSVKEMTREKRLRRLLALDPDEAQLLAQVAELRPRTRADCADGPRPCPFVSCRHHLFLEVNPETGTVIFNFPGKELWEVERTCSLDEAARGGITLEEIGGMMQLSRERIRQLEDLALAHLKTKVDPP
jgi:hypothetical protein